MRRILDLIASMKPYPIEARQVPDMFLKFKYGEVNLGNIARTLIAHRLAQFGPETAEGRALRQKGFAKAFVTRVLERVRPGEDTEHEIILNIKKSYLAEVEARTEEVCNESC